MNLKIKVKPKLKNGVIKVKAMCSHDMITYNQAKAKGIEANFITHVSATLESTGEKVFDISTSQFLSKNPIFKFQFKGAQKGDKVLMAWEDVAGNKGKGKGKIK